MLYIFLIVYIIICAAAAFFGYFLRFVAVKDKQMRYGLRTAQSQKSAETWEYANRTLGMHWLKVGFIGLILGVPVVLLMDSFKGESVAKALILVYVVFLVTILSISLTSVMKDMHIKFDEDGRPIERE